MTKVEFVTKEIAKVVYPPGDYWEEYAAAAIKACDEWERREKGLEGEARGFYDIYAERFKGAMDFDVAREQWLAIARKARELHGVK